MSKPKVIVKFYEASTHEPLKVTFQLSQLDRFDLKTAGQGEYLALDVRSPLQKRLPRWVLFRVNRKSCYTAATNAWPDEHPICKKRVVFREVRAIILFENVWIIRHARAS